MAKRERKRMTAGEKIANEALPPSHHNLRYGQAKRDRIARRVDAAVRKAAWEGFWSREPNAADDDDGIKKLSAKYGKPLGGNRKEVGP